MRNQCFFSLFYGLRLSCLWAIGVLLFLNSCSFDKKTSNVASTQTNRPGNGTSSIEYAAGFDIIEFDNYKILYLFRHYNELVDTLSFVLHPKNKKPSLQFKNRTCLEVPLENVALLHTSYLSFFELCNTLDHVKAISESKYIFNEQFYSSVISGQIPEVGYGESLDAERLLELGTDAVVTVGWPNTPNKNQQKLDELGIPMLIFSDWQESTLLGRAEWVKAIAALTGSEKLVEEAFRVIVDDYNQLKSMASSVENRPSIICNLPYKGSWFVPGGDSYMSNVLSDAGGNYLWAEDAGTGGLQVDFELVYVKGLKADIWINPGTAKSIKEVVDSDERLRDFNPIQTGQVYNFFNRVARGSANDYWESALIKPHHVLADFIKIIHPEVLPEHELIYYDQLN